MNNTLEHRGPDGSGVKVFADPAWPSVIAMAHRRLAIVDLTDAGLQPMANEDGTIWVVYNGEIYNSPALRAELIAAGHHFSSNTDTEVLVHLYEDLGPSLVARLNGIFAFAILDCKRKRVLLARDHIGVKPLFYSVDSGELLFGSEIKALLASRESRPTVNWQSIYDFFTFLYVPGPDTAFRNISQLPPAHTLVYDIQTRETIIERYWKVRELKGVASATQSQIEAELIERLSNAVRGELMSDVPLGVFLSGGVDSNVITALAARGGAPPHTFTVDFASPEHSYYSEAPLAAESSAFLGTSHNELRIDKLDPFVMLGLIDYFDQPFGNPTFYLQWLIARAAREHITVALSGAGGDELFAGYPRYRAAQLSRLARRLPEGLLSASRAVLRHLKDDHRTMRLRRIREFLAGMNDDPIEEFTQWTYYLDATEKACLMRDRTMARDGESSRILRRYYDESPLAGDNRMLHVDVRSFLVDNLLEYTDRMSMAVSMEVRVPLLEPDFVEYALNIPFGLKLGARGAKQIFKQAFRPLLAPAIRSARKRGFNAPLGQWMRGPLDEYFVASRSKHHALRDVLGNDVGITWGDEGVLNWNCIDQMRRDHREGRADLAHELFAVIVFDTWWRKYVTQTLSVQHWSTHGLKAVAARPASSRAKALGVAPLTTHRR